MIIKLEIPLIDLYILLVLILKYMPEAGLQQIDEVFTKVISVIVGLSFIVSLVVLAWAGIKYLTSGGEPKAIQAAHQALTWALLGILFLAIAWIILQLIQAVTGVQVTFFDIRALCGPNGDWCK